MLAQHFLTCVSLGRQRDGLGCAPELVLFTSEDCHYSIQKMAALLGLGKQNVCLVRMDKAGCMDPLHLESQVQKIIATCATPFMVVATAGIVYCLQTVKPGSFIVDTESSINRRSYGLFCCEQRAIEVIMHQNIITELHVILFTAAFKLSCHVFVHNWSLTRCSKGCSLNNIQGCLHLYLLLQHR
jgi:hypothetical protein